MKKNLLLLSFAILFLGGISNNLFSQNLLTNWGFEEDLNADGKIPEWNNLVGGEGVATYSLETTDSPEGNNHMKVDVQTLGTNGWSIQSFSSTFNAIQDSTYQVSWIAKSSVEGAEMNVIFQDQDGQQYGGKKTLTTEWKVYNKKWTAAATGEAYLKMWWMNAGLYEIDSVVVVDPNYQSIDFPSIDDKLTTDEPFTLSATASSGLAVTYTLVSGPATIDGSTVTLTGDAGTVVITASQAGNDSYNPAEDVEQSFNVIDESTRIDDFNVVDKSAKVYPTLFNDYIRIQSENKIVDVKMYNLTGVEMLHIHDLGGIEYVNQLDVLNTGVYFLQMKSDSKITVAKIIKE